MSQSQKINQGLVRRQFVPCPAEGCERFCCVHHMVCHHCGHVVSNTDLDRYRDAIA